MPVIIRQEKPADFDEIYEVVKTAFKTALVSDGDEQDYVNKLRTSSGYIPKLALVGEEDSKIIGHIMLTKTVIHNKAGSHVELLLAPLCVELSHRNEGVGAKLINESFRLAKELGYSAVFLCGDPNYYSRFGFRQIANFGISNTSEIPPQFVMACEISEQGLKNKKGTINII